MQKGFCVLLQLNTGLNAYNHSGSSGIAGEGDLLTQPPTGKFGPKCSQERAEPKGSRGQGDFNWPASFKPECGPCQVFLKAPRAGRVNSSSGGMSSLKIQVTMSSEKRI